MRYTGAWFYPSLWILSWWHLTLPMVYKRGYYFHNWSKYLGKDRQSSLAYEMASQNKEKYLDFFNSVYVRGQGLGFTHKNSTSYRLNLSPPLKSQGIDVVKAGKQKQRCVQRGMRPPSSQQLIFKKYSQRILASGLAFKTTELSLPTAEVKTETL